MTNGKCRPSFRPIITMGGIERNNMLHCVICNAETDTICTLKHVPLCATHRKDSEIEIKMEWQSMSTAPKDGTAITLFVESEQYDDNAILYVCCWQNDQWEVLEGTEWVYIGDDWWPSCWLKIVPPNSVPK